MVILPFWTALATEKAESAAPWWSVDVVVVVGVVDTDG